MMFTRIALYATLGVLCTSLELNWDTFGFWCIGALFFAADTIARREGFEIGVAQGIEMITDMTDKQRAEVMALVKEAQKEDNE